MNLIELYVIEVGKNLPARGRQDIQKELHSTLEDMLEDRAQKTGRPADEALMRELLTEYGAPKKVAAAYLPTRYLIGPRLYPFFTLVLKIVFSVLGVLGLIGLGVALVNGRLNSAESLGVLGKHALEFFGGLISAFGNIVLIFAILERVLPKEKFEDGIEDWTVNELAQAPETDEVKLWEPILGIVFGAAFLIVLNFYPDLLKVLVQTDGEWYRIGLLSDAFFRYLPWINLSGLLTIGLNLYLVRRGCRTTLSRWANLGLDMLSLAIVAMMLRGPSLVDVRSVSETGVIVNAQFIALLEGMFPLLATSILVIIAVITAIEVVTTLWKLLRPVKG